MGTQRFDQIQPAGGFELKVGQHDVWPQRYNSGERCLRVLRLAAHSQIRFALDGFNDASPHQRMILDDKNSVLHILSPAGSVVSPTVFGPLSVSLGGTRQTRLELSCVHGSRLRRPE